MIFRRYLNLWCLNSSMSYDLTPLSRIIIAKSLIKKVLFNSFGRNILNSSFVSVLRNIFCNMFNLLIISIELFDGLILNRVYGFILNHSFGYGHIFCSGLRNIFDILSFVRYLLLNSNRFIVNVSLFNRYMLDVRSHLRLFPDLLRHNRSQLLRLNILVSRLNILDLVLILGGLNIAHGSLN